MNPHYYLHTHARDSEAEVLYLQALAIREQVLGHEHPDTATSLNDLARLYRMQGKYTQAQPLYQPVLAIREHVLGHEHRETAQSLHNLARLYLDLGRSGRTPRHKGSAYPQTPGRARRSPPRAKPQ
ncbi:MAG TPA: tetratricopeptide repeat-containing protein [Ktedonobacteraceae bacterium]